MNTLVLVGTPAEFRTAHLLNTIPECYFRLTCSIRRHVFKLIDILLALPEFSCWLWQHVAEADSLSVLGGQ